MSSNAPIEEILSIGALVGLNIRSLEFDLLALVSAAKSPECFEITLQPNENLSADELFTIIGSEKKCSVFKGINQFNNSVECDIERVFLSGSVVCLALIVTSDVSSSQLRRFIRLTITLPVSLTGSKPGSDFFGPTIRTQSIDLSAGGMRALCSELYDINSDVLVELIYADGTAKAKGVVLRRAKAFESVYEYAIMFKQMDDSTKIRIAKYCEQAVSSQS